MLPCRRLLLLCFFIFALLGFTTSFAKVPSGSYRHSCFHCQIQHDKMRCVCRMHDQRLRYSEVAHVSSCHTVHNNNGYLHCKKHEPANADKGGKFATAPCSQHSCKCSKQHNNTSCRCGCHVIRLN